MGTPPVFFAVSFSHHEQQLLGWVLLTSMTIGAVGYALYKAAHLVAEFWPKLKTAVEQAIDFWFDLRMQVRRRQAELEETAQTPLAPGRRGSRAAPN